MATTPGRARRSPAGSRAATSHGRPSASPPTSPRRPAGGLRMRSRLAPSRGRLPGGSIAHADGVAIALATLGPELRPGLAIVQVAAQPAADPASLPAKGERAWLDELAGDGALRAEWV